MKGYGVSNGPIQRLILKKSLKSCRETQCRIFHRSESLRRTFRRTLRAEKIL